MVNYTRPAFKLIGDMGDGRIRYSQIKARINGMSGRERPGFNCLEQGFWLFVLIGTACFDT